MNRKSESEKILEVIVGDQDIVKAALDERAKAELAKVKKAETKASKKISVSEKENGNQISDVENKESEGEADDS